MQPTLKHVTCTGIDRSTDLRHLEFLQQEYPFAEFGVLLSAKPQDSPRYPGAGLIHSLRGLSINLALHLCGSLAREAAVGNWSSTKDLLGDDFNLFRRIQLNIAGYAKERFPEGLSVSVPESADEVIIQQKDARHCRLFLDAAARDPRLSVLLDSSGGRGRESSMEPLEAPYKTGFAGGLGPDNIRDAITVISHLDCVGDFWVDAESGLRTDDDLFSVEKAGIYLREAATAIRALRR